MSYYKSNYLLIFLQLVLGRIYKNFLLVFLSFIFYCFFIDFLSFLSFFVVLNFLIFGWYCTDKISLINFIKKLYNSL